MRGAGGCTVWCGGRESLNDGFEADERGADGKESLDETAKGST